MDAIISCEKNGLFVQEEKYSKRCERFFCIMTLIIAVGYMMLLLGYPLTKKDDSSGSPALPEKV